MHFSGYFSWFPFMVCHMICDFCIFLFSSVWTVCTLKIFMPSVSSLQSLTLGTRSVSNSYSFNLVSDTGHKSDTFWFI